MNIQTRFNPGTEVAFWKDRVRQTGIVEGYQATVHSLNNYTDVVIKVYYFINTPMHRYIIPSDDVKEIKREKGQKEAY